jgi:UPF0755 protein
MRARHLFLLFAALLMLGAGAAAALRWVLSAPSAQATTVLFDVPAGSTLSTVGHALAAQGLVRSPRAFVWLGRWQKLQGRLQAGEYEVSAAMPAAAILEMMAEGKVHTVELLVPEGITAAEIAERLGALGLCDPQEFLAVVRDPASAAAFGVEGPGLEGYLFPDTYRLPHGLAAREIARTLVAEFHTAWRGVGEAASLQGLSMRTVVILASIIEKETGLAGERPLIASVFRNRLARGMRLESDPTVIYGIDGFDGSLHRVDLENAANPYNTYRIQGLPPGPIANPGAAALHAVVEPATTDYFYFVSRNDGGHVFSRNYQEHVANVDRYQRRRSR